MALHPEHIISDGTLELYLMGALPEAEAREVTLLISQHPELQAEAEAIEQALMAYAEASAPERSDRALNGALTAIKPASTPTAPVEERPRPTPIQPLYSRQVISRYQMMAAAAVVLLVVSAAVNFWQYRTIQTVTGQLSVLKAEKRSQDQRMAEVESQFTTFRDRFQASLDPGARMVRLNGVDAYPQGRATVIWNETNGQVFFTLQDLPQPAPGQQYQLWALIDGQPVDAGVFDYETGNLQALKSVALNGGNLDAFAITLEPTGGSTVPTLTNMYLLGQA